MDIEKNFAANLRALRAMHQMSRAKLGRALKIHPLTIGNWESGTHVPTVKNAIKVSEYFGVSYLTLFDFNPLNRTLG